jgi:hypothetical protein
VKDAARMIKGARRSVTTTRDGKAVDTHHGSIEDLVKAGIMFVGTPDDVYRNSPSSSKTRGDGHFLMMGHAGPHDARGSRRPDHARRKEVLPPPAKAARRARSRRRSSKTQSSDSGRRLASGRG